MIYEGGTSRRNEKERQGREGGRPSKGRGSGSVLLGLTLNPEDSSEAFWILWVLYPRQKNLDCLVWYQLDICLVLWASLVGSDSKESACNAGDLDFIVGLGRSPGECLPTSVPCLENSMDRRASQATAHRVAKSQTRLSDWHFSHREGGGRQGSTLPERSTLFGQSSAFSSLRTDLEGESVALATEVKRGRCRVWVLSRE